MFIYTYDYITIHEYKIRQQYWQVVEQVIRSQTTIQYKWSFHTNENNNELDHNPLQSLHKNIHVVTWENINQEGIITFLNMKHNQVTWLQNSNHFF
jgi:hypothetical protein